MTLTDSIQQFVESRNSPKTRKTYATALARFSEFLERRHKRTVTTADLTENDPLDFAVSLRRRKASKFTINTYIAAVIKYLNDALIRDYLNTGFSVERAKSRVADYRKLGSYPIHEPQPVERVIQFYENMPLPDLDGTAKTKSKRLRILRGRALTWFLYGTMCRIGEARGLDRKQVADGRADEIILKHAKGDKDRFLFLPKILDENGNEIDSVYQNARRAIDAYVKERGDMHEPLFISHQRGYGHRLSEFHIHSTIKSAAKELGLDITPHDFRHARASQLLNAGAPLELISEMLGHADISTTKRIYAHYNKETITHAAVAFAPQMPVTS